VAASGKPFGRRSPSSRHQAQVFVERELCELTEIAHAMAALVGFVVSALASTPAHTVPVSLPSGNAAYDALCAQHGIYSVVELRSPAGGGERGLFAARALKGA
jgi:hypothetical protein